MAQDITQEMLDFIQQSPTPFHVCQNTAQLLVAAGFTQLHESEHWQCQPEQGYFVLRNDSSIIAFRTGTDSSMGINMVGAHTDSPCLKIKPQPENNKHGYNQLGVEVYGGALLNPWFDRDLSIAGRVSGVDKNNQLVNELIDIKKPIAIIPSLAIHLDREANKNRSVNPQQHLPLVVAQTDSALDFKQLLLNYCSQSLVTVLDYELVCYDTQAPNVVGLNDEFVVSARLDNLLSTFIGLKAIIDSNSSQPCLFVSTDHEEIGSASQCGAKSNFLTATLEHWLGQENINQIVHQSTMLSCDNAHALHPNYPDRHDEHHGPTINQGIVIKTNANQRYATNSVTSALFQHLCEQNDIPVQHFVVRSDMACGSTIGPITATELGIKTLDIGAPQWGMHSIRETAGRQDCNWMYQALTSFYENLGS